MAILIDIGHPAHVHFFKNALKEYREDYIVTIRDKEITSQLLDYHNIPYINMGKTRKGTIGKAKGLAEIDRKLMEITKKHKITKMLGIGSPYITTVGKFKRIPSFVFTDSEPVKIDSYLVYPLATKIITPTFFRKDLGKRQIRYKGCHELAYLRDFKPDKEIKKQYKNRDYAILRFVSWDANHDKGQYGFSDSEKLRLVKELEEKGLEVIISSEEQNKNLENYTLKTLEEKANIHSIMSMAKLCICDSQTMATEAALLGIPTMRSNTWVGKNDMGIFLELEQRGILENIADRKEVFRKIPLYLQDTNGRKETIINNLKEFKNETIDVNDLIMDVMDWY